MCRPPLRGFRTCTNESLSRTSSTLYCPLASMRSWTSFKALLMISPPWLCPNTLNWLIRIDRVLDRVRERCAGFSFGPGCRPHARPVPSVSYGLPKIICRPSVELWRDNHLRNGGIGQRLANLGIVISGGEHAVDEHYASAPEVLPALG